jgi:hypothetical protein
LEDRDPYLIPSDVVLTNQTAVELYIKGSDGHQVHLKPFERRMLRAIEFQFYDRARLETDDAVEVADAEQAYAFKGVLVVLGLSIWVAVIYGIVGVFVGSRQYWLTGLAAFLVLLCVGLLVDLVRNLRSRRRHLFRDMLGWGLQQLSLVLVVVIAVAVPAVTIYFAANVDEVVGWLREDPDDPAASYLVARSIQLGLIAFLALMPALLFFQFDREQLSKLSDEFIRNIIRFDPEMKSKRDVLVKYGEWMRDALGAGDDGADKPRLQAKRSPLVVATLMLALGWTLTLLHPELLPASEHAETRDLLVDIFRPEQSALTFGFLGAYFYALNLVRRDYIRRDLWPRTYTSITVRVVVAVILAWVLEAVLPWDPAALALAFLVGVVPETGLFYIQETVRNLAETRRSRDAPSLEERHPLTKLDGVDLYERARLEQEGITNVEALAHHNLFDLMLRTRIPARRLVDWTDQAVLYLHAGSGGEKEGERRSAALQTLGAFGIRTATDLETAYSEAESREDPGPVLSLLDDAHAAPGFRPHRVEVILDVIRDDESMDNLRYWRDFDRRPVESMVISAIWDEGLPAHEEADGPVVPTLARARREAPGGRPRRLHEDNRSES